MMQPWLRRAGLPLAGLCAASLAAVHVYVTRQGLDYAGALLFADHLFALAAVLALFALFAAIGLAVLERLNVLPARPIDRFTVSVAVGAGGIGTLMLLLGAAGALRPAALAVVFVLLALALRRQLPAVPAVAAAALACLAPGDRDRPLRWLNLSLFGLAAAFLLLQALFPPADWDALMYHIRIPVGFIEAGRIVQPLDNPHVALVGLAHMLYLPLLALAVPSGPALVSAGMALLLSLAVYSLAERRFDPRTAALGQALLWGTTSVVLVAITPRVDVTLALYVFLAHQALLDAPDSTARAGLAGVLLGFAVGIKYTGLLYVAALAPLVVWSAAETEEPAGTRAGRWAAFALLLAAAALPWLLKNWLLLGTPVPTFFGQTALPPWILPYYSGTGAAAPAPESLNFIWEGRDRFSLTSVFFFPRQATVEAEGAYYYTSPALLLLPLAVLFVRNRALVRLAVPALLYVVLLLLPFSAANLRFLLPAVAPLTIVVAAMVIAGSDRWLSKPAAVLFCVLFCLMALAPTAWSVRVWILGREPLRHFIGTVSAARYLRTHHNPEVRKYIFMAYNVNARLTETDRVLMLYESRGYYLRPQVIQDNMANNWPLLSAVIGPDDCLQRLGITHVLLGLDTLQFYLAEGRQGATVRWKAFTEFADRCLEPVFEGGGFVLFKVRAAGGN